MSVRARTYEVQHHANEAKLAAIRALLPVWRSGLVMVQMVQVERLRSGLPLGWLTKDESNPWSLPLSQRQLKSVTNQANGALRSWQALAKIEVRKLLRELDTGDDLRSELHTINNLCRWWSTDTEWTAGKRTIRVSEDALALARQLIARALQLTPFPVLGRVRTMLMDSIICGVEDADGDTFDRWLRIATLERGRPVLIPITTSAYFDAQPGTEAGVTQVCVETDGGVRFSRVLQSEAAEMRPDGLVVGMDWGIACLFTTSDGERLGQQFYSRLAHYDLRLQELQKSLQRNGIRPRKSKRYRALTRRIREYTKNEVNRLINWIVSYEDVSELVLESLDFRHGGLSRRMNRIVSSAGRAAVRSKLDRVTEDCGVKVTLVNPAYTSQQCSGCGFTARSNRTSQARFHCRFCGKTLHADVNAARVIGQRRSLSDDGLKWRTRQQVLSLIDGLFEDRWSSNAADLRERQSRGRSAAMSSEETAA